MTATVLRIDGKEIGNIITMNINHSPPLQYLYNDERGRTQTFHRQSNVAPTITYTAEVGVADIDLIREKCMGVQKIETHMSGFGVDDVTFKITGYAREWTMENGVVTIILETIKTPEQQEAERILNELRRRGYMQ